MLKSLLKNLVLPWWSVALPPRQGVHPYFGPPTSPYGGPDLKIRKLKQYFGNALHPSIVYVVSGKPLPLPFLRKARQHGIRIVLNQDGVYYPAWYSGDCALMNNQLRALHEVADFVIFQSRFCQDSCHQWVAPPSRPYGLLYNAVDSVRFSPPSEIPAGPLRLLASSYFNRSNGYVLSHMMAVLEEVVTSCGPTELVIAGKIEAGLKVPTTLDLPKALQQRGGRIFYHGPFSQAQAPDLYRSVHLLIHLKYMDPCPSTVLEAMACGVPVVHSDSGGTPELVAQGGIGVPVPLDYEKSSLPSPTGLANAIATIAANRSRYSESARQRVLQHFDLQNWMEAHRKIFQKELS